MRRTLTMLSSVILLLMLVSLSVPARAASMTVYVDPAGTCGGQAPCYQWISQALGNVSNGGTVIVTRNTNDNIISPATAQNITIQGENPGITLTGGGGVNITANPVVGWTIQDLIFTGGFRIQDVAGSLTVRNISTTGMTLGYFTQDTTADITIANNVLPNNDAAVISILSSPGHDINGSINIHDNTGVDAVNIFTYVTSAAQSDLAAAITLAGNSLRRGANIGVDSLGDSGTGNVSGAVVFSNNNFGGGKMGLTINGAATGDITGPVTFSGNSGLWLAALTIDSNLGGNITGNIEATGNDVEFIEIIAKGDLTAPVNVNGNHVTDMPGGVSQGPTVQVEGGAIEGAVNVTGTTGGVAYVSVRSRLSSLDSQVRVMNNSVGWIEIDSPGGSITLPFEISGNQLASNPLPGSPLGTHSFVSVHTGASGSLAGGSITGNAMDWLQLDIADTLIGALTISQNVFREYASLILAASGTSPGVVAFTGNDVATTYFDGFTTVAHFNRHTGMMTVTPGTSVSATDNWWGCSGGPGAAGCAPTPTSPTLYSPWLTFGASAICTGPTSATVGFDVRRESSGGTPSGNITPGAVSISTTIGSISQSPVGLVDGQGSASLTFPSASSPIVTVQLDAATVTLSPVCSLSRDSVGVFRPANGVVYLRNLNSTGYADVAFTYGLSGDRFIAGDWDRNNTDTAGNFRNGVFYLRNSNTTGYADITFGYGLPGDIPIAGDWNGDGVDTVGVFRNGAFYLRNSNTTGYADIAFGYGLPGDIPIAGDWNGDSIDTVGVFRNGVFYLRNSNTTGYADITFGYGLLGDIPIAGDWNDDMVDSVGTYRAGVVYLRNSNSTGYADVTFGYGLSGDQALAGNWDGIP